jgi:WD40 repeat protein
LAALDARTGNVTPWDPRGLGTIDVLVRSGGLLFAGGNIAFVGGSRRHGLAAIGSDGSLSDWNPQVDGVVRALALRPDNSRLYVGGAFAPGDAPTQRNLAVVDVSTGALHAFGGGTNSGVWALAPSTDGSTLYLGGAFVTVAGKRRVRLAALDATTGALLSWNSGANDLVRTLVSTDDALYVGGDFRSAGGLARARLVKLDSTGAALGWNPNPDDNVWTMQLREGTLYVGGEFGQVGGKARNQLAAVDVESGDASSWDPNADNTVRAVSLSPDRTRLLAAGAFEKMGSARRGYAEFTLPNGSLTGWSPAEAFDGYALAFEPRSGQLVIGGDGGVDVFR